MICDTPNDQIRKIAVVMNLFPYFGSQGLELGIILGMDILRVSDSVLKNRSS